MALKSPVEAAWDNLELIDLGEYEDGVGFVEIANSELHHILSDLRIQNPKAAAEIETTFERLTRAWPSLSPPPKPVVSKPVLRALVAVVEINVRQFSL